VKPDQVSLSEFEPSRRPGLTRVVASVEAGPAVELPLLTLVGDRPGPVFVAAAGVHGDEYEGPRALWQVAADLPPSALAGTVVLLPMCNPWAFAAGLRATPMQIDGVNLARTFPGNPQGSPTQRLAAALLVFVMRLHPTLFIDLHSGGVRYRFLPIVGYRRDLGDATRARAASRAFGLPALWAGRDHPGTFNSETARRGVTTVGVEMTGAGGCLDEDVAADREGILNLLRWLGMVRDKPAPEVRGPFLRTTDVPAPSGGYAVLERSVGDRVSTDTSIAHIRSPLGEVIGAACAPHDGTVWVTRHLRVIDPGEAICVVARPAEDEA